MKRFFWIIPLFVIILYLHTLKYPLVYDDVELIQENYTIKSFQNIFHFSPFKRPLREITFIMDWKIWDSHYAGWRFTNLVLHLIVCWLIFLTLNIFIKDRHISLILTFLYGIYPLLTESIIALSHRKEMLYSIFFLSSFLLYAKRKGWKEIILSFILFLCALLAKEVAIILPFILLFYEFLFKKKKRYIYTLPFFLVLILGFIYVFTTNRLWLPHPGHIQAFLNENRIFSGHPYSAVINTIPFTFFIYIFKLLIPIGLPLDPYIPIYNTLRPLTIFLWLGLLLYIYLIYLFARRNKLVSFALFFFLILFIPVSNIIPVVYPLAWRYMYLPSTAFFLILSYPLGLLKKKHYFYVVIAGLSIFYILISVKETRVWRNEFTLWRYVIKHNPKSFTGYNNLGLAYQNVGDFNNAENLFLKSIQVKPDYGRAYVNLSVIKYKEGDVKGAEHILRKAIEVSPMNPKAYFNLGIIMFKNEHNPGESLKLFKQAVKINPDFVPAIINVSSLLLQAGKRNEAYQYFQRAYSIAPENPMVKKLGKRF